MTTEKETEPVWTVVANIVAERPYGPGGQETKRGTKHFSPGTKVYIIDWYAGMAEDIIVVGLEKKSKRLIKIVIRATWVENLRVKMCYHPQVIAKIKEHYPGTRISQLNQEFAETMCRAIPAWQQSMRKSKALAAGDQAMDTPGKSGNNNSLIHVFWSWLIR